MTVPSVEELSRLAWSSYPSITIAGGMGAPHRAAHWAGPVACADLGVPELWGVQGAFCADDLARADLDAARSWMDARSRGRGWVMAVPATTAARVTLTGLTVAGSKPAFAIASRRAKRLACPRGVDAKIDDNPGLDDVVAAYGGSMENTDLARRLVVLGDLADPGRAFVVARRAGRPIGAAFVRWAGDVGYVSGIGVLPTERGRGVGRLLTCHVVRLAARSGEARVVRMRASAAGAALYCGLGFNRIDDEVTFSDQGDGRCSATRS